MAEGRPAGPSVDHGREPCPDRILDDIGGAFGMGAVGGGLWHLIKGLKNSPRNARMRGGVEVEALNTGEYLGWCCGTRWRVFVLTARASICAGDTTGSAQDRRQLRGLGRAVLDL